MRTIFAAALLAFASTPFHAQTPAPAADASAPRTYSNPLGFSYVLPADWEVADAKDTSTAAKDKATQNATSDAEKKGVACSQIGLTARHADPVSVIVQVDLPFDCYGQQFAQADLSGFGTGAAEGLKQNFDLDDPHIVSYKLGAHNLWAERVAGNLKGQPDQHFTIEISCSLLSRAAVCWLTMAADDASLAVFEQGAVTLEGDSPVPLVPAGTFKP